MRAVIDTFGVVAQLAFRNLWASGSKTLIFGGIIGFGAFLVVLGTSLLDSVDRAMSRSVVDSVAGNVQVFSSSSTEDVDVMSGFAFDPNAIDPLTDFAKVKATVESVPNVKSVVPMGINESLVVSGNTIDQALAGLRKLVNERQRQGPSPEHDVAYAAAKERVRQIIGVLSSDIENTKKFQTDSSLPPDELSSVARAGSPEFWAAFDRDPLGALEFLENRIAPLATDADVLFLRYLGTDPGAFARSFKRMTIVAGEPIPEGQRGFLFSSYVYEEQVKLETARDLDRIRQGRSSRGVTIATDPELARMAREAPKQVKDLLLQLDAPKSALFRSKLQSFLHSDETDVGKLLESFLVLTDQTFDERYDFFYRELAPMLALYRVPVGDTLTIKAFTRSGYIQSTTLEVYGVFAFEGLETSPQAGALNLMDMVSFRELYGFMTDERQKEIAALRANSGAKDVTREDAEAELFGSSTPTARADAQAEMPPDLTRELSGIAAGRRTDETSKDRAYDPAQLEQGVILNAAVLLEDERRLDETIAAIEAAGERDGLPLRAISWQKAAGLIGQFAVLMRVVLYTAVLIIFLVALVIINNALVMATLERVREIGTLRAVGAQQRFILAMLVLESIMVGLTFGIVGALIGGAAVEVLGEMGIPALNAVSTFFFSGPRLYPAFGLPNLIVGLVVVLIVSIVSSLYPAWIAMRISPREAMQAED